jgi:hypothetical protein
MNARIPTWLAADPRDLVLYDLFVDDPALDDGHPSSAAIAQQHRTFAVTANNAAWELLEREDLSDDDADDLLECAYAAAYHWTRAAGSSDAHRARAAWLISRCHAVLGHGDLALHHAVRCTRIAEAAGLGDFDLGYAHEARARAHACLGNAEEATLAWRAAAETSIADPEDRRIFESDLAAEPWFGVIP